MATNGKVPYGYGGPVPRDEDAPTPQPDKSCISRACGKRVIGASIVMFACLAVMFLLIVSVPARVTPSKAELEIKHLGELHAGLTSIVADPARRDMLRRDDVYELGGERFYEMAFREGLLDSALLGNVVSLNSTTDAKASREFVDNQQSLPANSCSYTAPKAGELAQLLERGQARTVLITFNSRNWNNYSDDGVIIIWADGNDAEFLTFAEANEQFGITAEDWADPAGKLFGRKAPFQYTYE